MILTQFYIDFEFSFKNVAQSCRTKGAERPGAAEERADQRQGHLVQGDAEAPRAESLLQPHPQPRNRVPEESAGSHQPRPARQRAGLTAQRLRETAAGQPSSYQSLHESPQLQADHGDSRVEQDEGRQDERVQVEGAEARDERDEALHRRQDHRREDQRRHRQVRRGQDDQRDRSPRQR